MVVTGAFGPCRWSFIQGALTEADVDAFVDYLRDLAATLEPGQVVLDIAYDLPMPTPVQRRRIVDTLKGASNLERAAGHAFVINSSIGRRLLTAINWVLRPPFEERVFSHPEEAVRWLEERNRDLDGAAVLRRIGRMVPGFDALRW